MWGQGGFSTIVHAFQSEHNYDNSYNRLPVFKSSLVGKCANRLFVVEPNTALYFKRDAKSLRH
jgi:hypothetical protein